MRGLGDNEDNRPGMQVITQTPSTMFAAEEEVLCSGGANAYRYSLELFCFCREIKIERIFKILDCKFLSLKFLCG